MHDVVLDFETFYSREFSLSKMPMQQYIESPEFEIILVAAQRGHEEPQWFSGTLMETRQWLLDNYDIENARVIAHNAQFDGGILERRLALRPKAYLCTRFLAAPVMGAMLKSLSLATIADKLGIGQKGTEVVSAMGMRRADFDAVSLHRYAEYCMNDVALCGVIARMLEPLVPETERALIDLTVKKFTRPQLWVDADILEKHRQDVLAKKQVVLERLGLTDRKVLMSNEKFAQALYDLGVTPPRKPSPSNPEKMTWAFAKTDDGMRQLLNHENPEVVALAEARLMHKSTIEETRAQRFIDATQYSSGHLCVPLIYYGAHTGRFSGGSGINLQNLGRKSVLRKAIKAVGEDHVVLAGDLSQIEARMVATLAGEQQLIDAFAEGVDVYAAFGERLYNKPISKEETPLERFVAKTAILMLGYGAGAVKFFHSMQAAGVDITVEEAQRVVNVYRDTYSSIRELWYTLDDIIGSSLLGGLARTVGPITFHKGYWKSPAGVKIYYPKLQRTDDGYQYLYRGKTWRKLYGGALLENICQHLARCVLAQAELRMSKYGFDSALSVHDELVYSVPRRKADKFAKLLEKVLTTPVEWLPQLPLECEVNYGESYAECK